jgi:hypothetical protein
MIHWILHKGAEVIRLSICCLLTLIAGLSISRAAAAGLDAKAAVPLEGVFEQYQDGGIGDKAFSAYVDEAYARLENPVEKAEFLQRVVDFLEGRGTQRHDVDTLELGYAAQLVKISDQPDVVVDALMHEGLAMSDKAQTASGDKRRALLLSALKCYIGCSKIIAGNLVHSKQEDPAVGSFEFSGDTDSPEYKQLVAEHAAQVARRAFDDQQNNMLDDCRLLNKDEYRRLVDELHLSNEGFAKIWSGVETKSFERVSGRE